MMNASLGKIGRGFSNPVLGSQAVFRAALHALSHPGQAIEVPCDADILEIAYRPAAALMLALLDADTTLWLSEALRASIAPAWLKFHTGCKIVSDPGLANFAWVSHFDALPPPQAFAQGSAEYPDQSTCCVYELPSVQHQAEAKSGLSKNNGVIFKTPQMTRPWRLSGPGLREPLILMIDSLPQDVADQIEQFRVKDAVKGHLNGAGEANPSRRIDLLLATPSRLIGLPRSTHLSLEH
jgi:alpha-D-ribose 1-methylphosphonate 5-triphosphate synthase subunit PhnH